MKLYNRNILVGVTGGIAAYKSVDLVRRLKSAGAGVRVVMTASATRFVTPLTFEAVSQQRVATDWFEERRDTAMDHIELARWADVILVAPASANFMARLRGGFADELLPALCLAADVPVWVAPAMNQQMWASPANQENCRVLADRGVVFIGPDSGSQACGESGPGRMSEPEDMISRLEDHFAQGPLWGVNVIVTAGPTREAIDPVRYISNRSSGKMGYAVARAAVAAGATVTLISGPTALATPQGVQRIDVESARDMYDAVLARADRCDIFIGAAAVSDYRHGRPAAEKIKKTGAPTSIELEPTEDILAAIAQQGSAKLVVGFAAETTDLEDSARKKLHNKGLDLIAANLVGSHRGFDVDDNELLVLWRDGSEHFGPEKKLDLGKKLISLIVERYHEKNSTPSSG